MLLHRRHPRRIVDRKLLRAALRFCRNRRLQARVTFVCDTGTRYLSKVYNDQWMIDQVIHRRLRRPARHRQPAYVEGGVVSVVGRYLLTAFQRMRQPRLQVRSSRRRVVACWTNRSAAQVTPIRHGFTRWQGYDDATLETLPLRQPRAATNVLTALVAIIADKRNSTDSSPVRSLESLRRTLQ